MTKKRINLDCAAATLLDKKVKKAMDEAEKFFGNPSSIHTEGVKAKEVVEDAKKKIGLVLGCKSNELIFTSGGTESDNLAVFGVARRFKKGHIVTSGIEHPAVLEPCKQLEKEGFKVTYIPVDKNGFVNPEDVKKYLCNETILVSVIYANNEIGTIQPIREISKIINEFKKSKREDNLPPQPPSLTKGGGRGEGSSVQFPTSNLQLPYFHTDACQTAGFLNLKVETLGVDLLTLNASKIYGPKGIGILYKKSGIKISPLIYGGGQEGGLRSGTESPVLCAGMAEALVLVQENKKEESRRLLDLRNFFIKRVLAEISNAELNGSIKNRLPNNANFYFKNCNAEELLVKLDLKGIACSSGSACASQFSELSRVILALGKGEEAAKSSVRFSIGRGTNKKELDYVIKVLKEVVL